MKINPRVFWMNVKSFRISNEWSQADLASKVGLDPKNYSNKERGIANRVPMDLALKIAEALGTTVESLATGEEPEEPLFDPEIVSFFNNVRIKRESLGISQKAMAEILGMSPTNWQTKESGKVARLPSSLAEKIAEALGCTVDELREEKETMKPPISNTYQVTEKPKEILPHSNNTLFDMSHLPQFVQRFISNKDNADFITNIVDEQLSKMQR